MALHGGVIPYGGTFLIFSDYSRPAIRLSALQQTRVIHVMTHDSIGLGEDGPTHQPIEQMQSLRTIPDLAVFRPADTVETAECWAWALESAHVPSLLALTRQNLPQLRLEKTGENLSARGAYRLRAATAARKVVLVGTGSEVSLAVEVADALEAQGIGADVVSMPCTLLFDRQEKSYQADILPRDALIVSIEAGTTVGLGTLHGPRRRPHRHRPVRRIRAGGRSVQALRLHRRGRSCRGCSRRSTHRRRMTMATRVAINGFGRIGRLVARAILERPDSGLELVTINDLADAKSNAWLFSRDSVHGKYPGSVSADGNDLVVDGKRIKVTAERDPAKLPHKENAVDLVLECTGFFTDRESAQRHIDAGAKKVLISAPAKGVDLTVVYGVNHDKLEAGHTIVSNASCTTNCLAPVAKVLNDSIGIERGLMTTVHAYTNDQKILDQIHPDLRRARAAAMSMIPTTTGAARAVGEVLPELKGKLDGSAIRVPVPDGSLIDLHLHAQARHHQGGGQRDPQGASESGPLKGILVYSDEPLVSVDLVHTPQSSTIDSLETAVLEGKLVRVVSWYDNEWGFSNRMVDTAGAMAKLL